MDSNSTYNEMRGSAGKLEVQETLQPLVSIHEYSNLQMVIPWIRGSRITA